MKLYLGKSDGYELGTAESNWSKGGWSNEFHFGSGSIEHFCKRDFEKYVTIEQDGEEVVLKKNECYKVKKITVELE